MFSYIFMKILESRPGRYDKGINILSLGITKRIRSMIVRKFIKKDSSVLDIGCGTGTLAIDSSLKGADVVGIDISKDMLDVARKKLKDRKWKDKVAFRQAGVADLDSMFEENSFDTITSTLVFSELYPDERKWTLDQARRVLKKDGTLVVACEVVPRNTLKRVLHWIVRFPLAVLTYLVAQTGTNAVPDLEGELLKAGFEIKFRKYFFLDSLALLAARKVEGSKKKSSKNKVRKPGFDISFIRTIWDYIGRWFPDPVEPGIRAIGHPGRNSPVMATSNYHLTVRRVERSLKGMSCYLLVAPTGGINVWCGSAGGEMTEHSIISVIKTSGISELVDHRSLLLPLLCAPGVDRKVLNEHTGWEAGFGPLYSKDIPTFLKTGKLEKKNTSARFKLPFRLEMLFSMNFLMWLAISVPMFIISMKLWLFFSALYWGAALILFGAYNILPGKSGWLKSIATGVLISLGILSVQMFYLHDAGLSSIGWVAGTMGIVMWMGFDLRGIVTGETSEAVGLLTRLDIGPIGKLHKPSVKGSLSVHIDPDICIACRTCIKVCPVNVFEFQEGRVDMKNRNRCMKCLACIKQCPVNALDLR